MMQNNFTNITFPPPHYPPIYGPIEPNHDSAPRSDSSPSTESRPGSASSSQATYSTLLHEVQQTIEGDDRVAQQPYVPSQPDLTSSKSAGDVVLAKIVKSNRLRKACDSCSVRKVKCDESGPPCRACRNLDIPCTFARPTKRRGPPNRHAAAIKRQELNVSASHDSLTTDAPSDAAHALAALSSHISTTQLSAESICPIDTLDLLLDDFFTYIHPLCPFPHEPSFREAWQRREDLNNKPFLALLASMIGALVASFPRKPRLHLKAQRKEQLFPNHMSLIQRCQQVCALARGPAYLENEHISIYDAATSYFLGLMGTYTFRWRQGRLYLGECLTIIRTLGLERADDESNQHTGLMHPVHSGGSTDAPRAKDNITVQIGRRIFWTMFVGAKTLQQIGALFEELQIPPPTITNPYPPLPLEVDDMCIYPGHIEPQPPGVLSIIAGFNANVRAFSSYCTLSAMEVAWGIDHVVDWERQKRVLKESLGKCKDATASLPAALKVELPHETAFRNSNGASSSFSHSSMNPARSLLSLAGVHDDNEIVQTAEQRRHVQHEIQKANIYASSLSTRSYIVQKYWSLAEAHAQLRAKQTSLSRPNSPQSPIIGMLHHKAPATSNFDMTEQDFRQERETIVKDLLVVLSSIDQVSMEPNAESFTMKIRSIASTLLDAPDSMRGHMELQAKEYLAAFLEILIRLERVSTNTATPQEDEAAELREWANLREYQLKFAQQESAFFR